MPRAPLDAAWEGYQRCPAHEIPTSIVWSAYQQSGPVQLGWGNGTGWGAPYRRILNPKTGSISFARYIRTFKPRKEA